MRVQRAQNYLFENVDTLLRLSEVEFVLRKSRVFKTIPSRPTLIEYCDEGILLHRKFRGQYLVYESSLLDFIHSFQQPTLKAA